MTSRLFEWRGRLSRAVLLAMVMSVVPLSVAAAEERPAPEVGPIKASIKKISVNQAPSVRVQRASATPRAQQPGADRDASFFKSKPGIVALAVMVLGTGYAIYSAQNDRISSPGKE